MKAPAAAASTRAKKAALEQPAVKLDTMSAVQPSSHDLHPRHGARLVFTREDGEAPRYRVEVFLPEAVRVESVLSWDDGGAPALDPVVDDAAVREQIFKLARVLKRTPKARLTRWREL